MEAPGRRTITLQVQVGGVVIAGHKAPLAGLPVLPILGPELLQLVCQLAHAQRLGVVGRLACSSDSRTVITCHSVMVGLPPVCMLISCTYRLKA